MTDCASCHDEIDMQKELTLGLGKDIYHTGCLSIRYILTPRHKHPDGTVHHHEFGLKLHFHKHKDSKTIG